LNAKKSVRMQVVFADEKVIGKIQTNTRHPDGSRNDVRELKKCQTIRVNYVLRGVFGGNCAPKGS